MSMDLLKHIGQELKNGSELTKGEINRDKLANLIIAASNEHERLGVEYGIIKDRYKKLIKHLGKDTVKSIINEDKQQQIEKMSGHWEDWIKEVEKLSI